MIFFLTLQRPFKPNIMKRLFMTGLLILVSSLQFQLRAWDIIHPIGSRAASLGRCSVALSDLWSNHNNPAGLASIDYIGIGISYENRFLLKELGYKNIAFAIPSKFGSLGISISQFGYKYYNENIFGFSYSKNFGPNLNIGLKLDYIFLKLSEGYNNKSTATFEVGIQYNINKKLRLGAYIFNPIYVKIRSPNDDRIPIVARFGLSYNIIDNFMITTEIEEHSEKDFSFRLGLEYEIYKNLFIRSGFQMKPELFTFGLGYEYKNFVIDICGEMHHKLGASLCCSLIFKIIRNSKL